MSAEAQLAPMTTMVQYRRTEGDTARGCVIAIPSRQFLRETLQEYAGWFGLLVLAARSGVTPD